MSKKYCQKKGHHEGRLIEAICLRPQCRDDRLLCFYCKHQNHRFHETAYFPKGLPASLQTFNRNSCIENAQKQRLKIDRKILTIKKSWQNVENTMLLNVKSIQTQINNSYETIQNTFSPFSVQRIKQKLSTQDISPVQVQKYVKMINHVNFYELNNEKKVQIYASLKQRVLQDVFKRAALQVNSVMKDIEYKSKNLNFSSEELQKYMNEYFDQENNKLYGNKNFIQHQGQVFFSDEDSNNEFKKRFENEYDETQSDFTPQQSSQQEQKHILQSGSRQQQKNISYKKSPIRQIINSTIKQNVETIMSSSSPSYSPKKFKIRIGKFVNQQQQQSVGSKQKQQDDNKDLTLQQLCSNYKTSPKKSQRLQYRNILKLKNDISQKDVIELKRSQQSSILCCRKLTQQKILPQKISQQKLSQQKILQQKILQQKILQQKAQQQKILEQKQTQQKLQQYKLRKQKVLNQLQDEQNIVNNLNKTKKKIKPSIQLQNINNSKIIEQEDKIIQARINKVITKDIKQKKIFYNNLNNLFSDYIPEQYQSSQQSQQNIIKKLQKKNNNKKYQNNIKQNNIKYGNNIKQNIKQKNNQNAYCNFDFSKNNNNHNNIKTKNNKQIYPSINIQKNQQHHNDIIQPQTIKQSQPQLLQQPLLLNSYIFQQEYIEIQRKLIKLPPHNHKSNKLKSHSYLYPHVKVYGNTLDQIYQSLQLIDSQVVTKLQIYCDTTTLCVDTQCIDLICQMKKLKSLMIYMTYQMDKKQVKKICKNLSQLQELVLCEFNKMDADLAKSIKEQLPRLKRFFYTVDYRNYMQKMQQNLQFFIDFNTPSTSLQVVDILASIPTLQTIQIINVNNKVSSKIPQLLKRMKNLKQICITNTNNIQSNSTQIVQFLANSQLKLQVFCVQNTFFKQESLIKILQKNKKLQTLIINECMQFHNEAMAILSKNCPNLQQLSLMLIDSIKGRQICTFRNLKTLVLRGCWQIDQDYFFDNIHKLSQLQFLSVSLNNYWFYDPLMKEVVKLSKLKFLNLDTTKVSDQGIKDLHKLEQLETLICGKTQITFQQLIKALKGPETKNLNIRKLGLSKDQSYSKQIKSKQSKNKHDLSITQFHAKHLLPLGRALPGLTHLSIGGFTNPKKEYFQTLTNLKCLFVTKKQLASQTQNWLVSKGVNINEDY